MSVKIKMLVYRDNDGNLKRTEYGERWFRKQQKRELSNVKSKDVIKSPAPHSL